MHNLEILNFLKKPRLSKRPEIQKSGVQCPLRQIPNAEIMKPLLKILATQYFTNSERVQ